MTGPLRHRVTRKNLPAVIALLIAAVALTPLAAAAPHQNWHAQYATAYRQAEDEGKMLLIFFSDNDLDVASGVSRSRSISQAELQESLSQYVIAHLPLDATFTADGSSQRLLDHSAFGEIKSGGGIAIVDLASQGTPHHGHVVSLVPFRRGKYYQYRPEHLSVVLTLPRGTLTQRTMIFAVRIHPEAPASTAGQPHPTLVAEANSHSEYQAQIAVQGHHHWETRYQRITGRLPDGHRAVEVVAESWPDQGLVDSCVDCVASWRQSPGHWSAVQARHPIFGYDIKRGRNGIWYATGIFGRRR